MDWLTFIPLLVALFMIVLLLRLLLVLTVPHRGNDAYYFLLCAEAFKKHRRIPIVLPKYYLLELQEQWYPPGFSVFLALMPAKILYRYYWIISPVLDTAIGTITLGITYFFTHSLLASAVAGILYALTLSTIRETVTLTSRQLGSLFFSLTLVMAILYVDQRQLVYLIAYLCFGFLLLMTHKLSYQAYYVVMPALSLVTLEFMYLVLLIGLLGFVYIFSGGFLGKILKAHYDIVSFWYRHWGELGAHQVYDSPIYGNNVSSDHLYLRYHRLGFRQRLYQLAYLFAANPALPCALFVKLWFPNLILAVPYAFEFFSWAVIVVGFGLSTIWIKPLRCLGEGDKYYKLTALPAAYVASLPLATPSFDVGKWLYLALLVVVFGLSIGVYLRFSYGYRQKAKEKPDVFSNDLQNLVDYLGQISNLRLMCIPTDLCDTIVHHCKVPVLWGTHGYSFHSVEPFFPVLRESVEYFQEKYDLTHLILDTRYVKPEVLDFDKQNCNGLGPYLVCNIKH